MASKDIIKHQFRPGESGNKNGSRAYHHRKKAAREVSTECLQRIATALFDGSLDDLKILAESPDITPIEKLCCSVVIRSYVKGDSQALEMLLDRFVGRPQIFLANVDSKASKMKDEIMALTDEQLDQRLAEIHRLESDSNKLPVAVREAHMVLAEYYDIQ